jgi:hypothetical protein
VGVILTPGGSGGPEPPGYVGPVYDYVSDGAGLFGGNSVVGGYVYRGPDPEVQGRYFFADSFPAQLWTFDPADPDGTVTNVESILDPGGPIGTPVSFAEDTVGNLYIVAQGGKIYRIETDALAPGDYDANGVVDQDDYLKWRTDYGAAESTADGNGDGTVDAADYTLWRDNLPQTESPQSFGVPSPSGAALAALLAVTIPWRRCRST